MGNIELRSTSVGVTTSQWPPVGSSLEGRHIGVSSARASPRFDLMNVVMDAEFHF